MSWGWRGNGPNWHPVDDGYTYDDITDIPAPPGGHPDHYPCNNSSPAAKGGDLDLEELGLI